MSTRRFRLQALTAALSVLALACTVAAARAEDLSMTVGQSTVLDFSASIGQLSTSNPDIVDASPVTHQEVLLHAKSYGTATVIVWGKGGEKRFYNITVELNLDPLRKLYSETFPGLNIQVQSARDSLSITGHVPTKEIGDRVAALAAPFAKTVVNDLTLDTQGADEQVLLHVVFALLDRSVEDQFAVNLVSTGAGNTPGGITSGGAPAPQISQLGGTIGAPVSGTTTTFTISDALNIFAFRPDLNLGAFIRALQTRQLLQILAEPNLLTSNGKEASFVAGGEFPVPVLQGGAAAGAITIMYREFGIKLNFSPQITEHQTIRIHVKPEVSSLDFTNAITLNGFTIPALATRKAETYVELSAGQTFLIAGLLDDEVTQTLTRIPGLANLPILGALFRSKAENRTRTELVIMVTPRIASPLKPGEKPPLPEMIEPFLPPAHANTPKAKAKPVSKFWRHKSSTAASEPAPAATPAASQSGAGGN
jgi:pilus assembly protein CpaC